MNILLITSIYPLPTDDNQGTPVCHYFTREWVKMGHNVRVVHYQAIYPTPFYWAARLNRKAIVARTGAVVYTRKDQGAKYEKDGVLVYRIPLFKPIPHGKFSSTAVRKSIRQIVAWCKETNFTPDVITGHFPNPQIEVVGKLRCHYPDATTAIVMHGDIELAKKVYGSHTIDLCRMIDLWGFRSESIRKSFEMQIMPIEHGFICYSGIPEDYITKDNKHDFSHPIWRFVYVGEMIERKYPIEVMDALKMAYPDGNYQMTYVGQGKLLEKIRKRVDREGLDNQVETLGKIPRDDIREQYDRADCMVMISRGEAYGLVYLEAMARGCITIAGRNEGFDGVIRDGENGFLCNAGDAKELASIIHRINHLSPEERQRISDSAVSTAKALTDHLAAKRYFEDLTVHINRL